MTTRVATTVVCPNVPRARISTEDKQADGTWKEAHGQDVEIGQTIFADGYITDTRRIVISEIPLKPPG
jgi:hypothetical protein